jgi:hypothetical protein
MDGGVACWKQEVEVSRQTSWLLANKLKASIQIETDFPHDELLQWLTGSK